MIKTFISHSSEEDQFVTWLGEKLRQDLSQLDIFIDHLENRVGDKAQEMLEEVKKTVFFIPILSDSYLQRPFCINERITALQFEKKEFPVLINLGEIPEDLRITFERHDKVKDTNKICCDFRDEQKWQVQYELLSKSILEEIVNQGLLGDETFYNNCEHIDMILGRTQPTNHEIKMILKIYLPYSEYERYFFTKVKDRRWLQYLFLNGCFSNPPGPQQSEKSDGYFIPHWPVLDYLEKVSRNPEGCENTLLDIIRQVSQKKVDNYRTWWYFVKVLLNLPNGKIPIDVIKLIPIWLETKFDTTLQGAEVALKLLPKFLESTKPEDLNKAELIVKYILTLRESKTKPIKTDILREKKEYKTVVDVHWIEGLLGKYGKQIGEKCSRDLICDIIANVKMMLHEDESETMIAGKSTYNIELCENQDKYTLQITKTDKPPKDVREANWKGEPIGWLHVATLNIERPSPDSNRMNLDDKILRAIQSCISELDEEQIKKKIFWLEAKLYDSNTYSSFFSKGHPRYETVDLCTEVLKTILNGKAAIDKSTTELILNTLLNDKYIYFKKMALYVMGNYPQLYGDIYFQHLKADKYNLLLDGLYFGDEIKHLFQGLKELKPEDIELLDKRIVEGPILHDLMEEKGRALWRQERYQALSHIPYFHELYNAEKKLTEQDAVLHAAFGEVQSGFVEHVSPISNEEIMKKSVQEIVDYIKQYKPPARGSLFREEGVQGLGGELSKAIQQNPQKYLDDMSQCMRLGYYYVYCIIGAFRNAWKDKKVFDIQNLLVFIKKYVALPSFGSPELIVPNDGWEANDAWVVGIIGEFIQEGTRDDTWAFDPKYFVSIKEIIFLCLNRITPSEKSSNDDPVTDALNTHQGKLVEALIDFALRIARINEKKIGRQAVNWDADLRNKYEEVLKKGIIDAYTLFGRYMSQLDYLDKDWVEKTVKEFEKLPTNSSDSWEAFMTGYLYGNQVRESSFVIMATHYLKGLEYEFKNTHARVNIIQHITIGYLRGIQQGVDLYGKVIREWKYSQIQDVIGFYWTQVDFIQQEEKDKKDEELKTVALGKIRDFWLYVYEKYKGTATPTDDDKALLSEMTKIIAYLAPIDNVNKEWIKLAAKYVEHKYNSSLFIEYLNELKNVGTPNESAQYVGEIFDAMLDNFTPTFPEEDIEEILGFLKANQKQGLLDSICNKYGKKGVYSFRAFLSKP